MKSEKEKIIQTLIPILKHLRKIYGETNDENIKKSIKKMTRTLIAVSLENVPADYVSNDAWREIKNYKELKKNSLPWSLRRKSIYHDIFKKLTYEHCIPFKEIIEEIYTDNSSISKALGKLETAWITTDENKRLNQRGYKSNRHPFEKHGNKLIRAEETNWKRCYYLCEIRGIK